jgi:hypothetical protein
LINAGSSSSWEDGTFVSWRPMISSRLEDLRVFMGSDLERSTLSGNWAGDGLGDGGRSGSRRSIMALVAPGDRAGKPDEIGGGN